MPSKTRTSIKSSIKTSTQTPTSGLNSASASSLNTNLNPSLNPTSTSTSASSLNPTYKISICTQTRKALLIGLNYTGTANALNGCVNDVSAMAKEVKTIWQIKDENIIVKTDKELTKDKGIISHLNDLTNGAKAGDVFFFHYSGHGLQVTDDNGDEADGLDEALYTPHEIVRDDEISKVLMKLPKDCTMIMVFDCCHSGTMADLMFQYSNNVESRYANYNKYACNVITISGCQDSQCSADAWIFKKLSFYGALTATLLDCFKDLKPDMIWKDLIDRVIDKVKKDGYEQIPQFCATQQSLLRSKVII